MWRRKNSSAVSRGAKPPTDRSSGGAIDDGPPLYELIRSNIGPNGWLHGAVQLPGATGQPGSSGRVVLNSPPSPEAVLLAERWATASHHPTPAGIEPLATALRGVDTAVIGEPLRAAIRAAGASRVGLQEVAVHLIRTSSDVATVKIAIDVLGLVGFDDLDGGARMIHLLGLHDEFAIYAAIAFELGTADREGNLFRLAKSSTGWGRVHCVHRLGAASAPHVQDWLIREGFRNAVGDNTTAWAAALGGRLHERLHSAEIESDRALLNAVGELFVALTVGPPNRHLIDVPDSARIVERYFEVLASQEGTSTDRDAVQAIERVLAADRDWGPFEVHGWSAERRATLAATASRLRGRLDWTGPDPGP